MGARRLTAILTGGALLLACIGSLSGTPFGFATTIRLSDGGLSRESSLEWRARPRTGIVLCADSYDSPGWGGDYRIGCGLLYRLVPRRFTLDIGPGTSINAAPGHAGQLSLDAAVRAKYGVWFAEATGLFFRDGVFCPSLAGIRIRVWRRLRLHIGGGGYYITNYRADGFVFTAAAGASYGP